MRESIRKEERKEKGRDKTKKRVKELDSFKGFLIFLVVLGHFLLIARILCLTVAFI